MPITADPAAAVRFAQLILATAHGGDRKALLDAARLLSGADVPSKVDARAAGTPPLARIVSRRFPIAAALNPRFTA